ncbi:putative sulfate exporter family transporter [Paenibacillus sp. ACRRX]|uniref:YeiH family protein n=1 Tax=Paenibacillus sp. ACRRX TaxID=2918206 RepID=UPI001EF70845|nr:putative sulfate exporter family transporter [Paenibacillus sp. ACRRX]MCG7410512.1 putative sulfate exporter family transporter [Paenibacillus sp. ACRRX]
MYPNIKRYGFIYGIVLALILSLAARYIGKLPGLHMLGPLVIAILLGMAWRHWLPLPHSTESGIRFAAQKVLRLGIILMGLRLNWQDLASAGSSVLWLAAACLLFGIFVVYAISRWFGIDHDLAMLVACGTGICGAAAVVAVAPQLDADRAKTGTAVAIVCVMGTLFTMLYALVFPMLPWDASQYGRFAGATLHEVAHVVAATDPLTSAAVNLAIMVKLSRVALLAPVALLLGVMTTRRSKRIQIAKTTVGHEAAAAAATGSFAAKLLALPIPWFVFGFLAAAAIRSLGWVQASTAASMVDFAYILLGMGMAGLGLNMRVEDIRQHGVKAFAACFIGSLLLAGLAAILIM